MSRDPLAAAAPLADAISAPCYELRLPVGDGTAHLVSVHGDPALLDDAHERLLALDALWSTSDPDSELSRVTRTGGRPVTVSPETLVLVGAAYEAHRLTAVPVDGDVVIDTAASTVCVPTAMAIDLSCVANGLAADLVLADLLDGGAAGACVNVGGAIRVAGIAPRRDGWVVGVDDPRGDGLLGSIRVRDAAIATVDGVTVTLVGDSQRASWAEALARAAASATPSAALSFLERQGATGVVVDDRGVHLAAGWLDLAA
jgi:FAD:protein FMN transferase